MSLSLGVGSTTSFCSFFVTFVFFGAGLAFASLFGFDSFLVAFSVAFFSVVFFATLAFGSALPCSLL